MENKIVKYKNFEWYVLEEKEESLVLLMKELLNEEVVIDICDDEEMYDNNHIAHIKNGEKYDWKTSYVRKVLNDKFLDSYLNKNDLVKMNEDYVRLLKLEEIEWENEIFKSNDWYSLMTKMGPSHVAFVNAYGNASGDHAGSDWLAVRPVIEVKKTTLEKKRHIVEEKNGTLYIDDYKVDDLIDAYEKLERNNLCSCSSCKK